MNYYRPEKLKKGDTIAFIAPAGCITDEKAINNAKKYFENEGYNVVFSKHLFNNNRYLSDTDENRLEDLHWAFSNKSVDAIICARGGYGCLRLIDKIDYNLIRTNPKIFCGYSDITVLSTMFLKHTHLITYSAPMAKGDFGLDLDIKSKYTLENFYKAVNNNNLEFKSKKLYKNGQTSGITFGGNLSSIVSLCGIDFIPDEDFIFFAEDINEPVYKIDKMFTQLLHVEKFRKNIKGLVLGDFIDCGYPEQLDDLFMEIAKKLNIPVCGGFNITHNKDKITIPIGENCRLSDGIFSVD